MTSLIDTEWIFILVAGVVLLGSSELGVRTGLRLHVQHDEALGEAGAIPVSIFGHRARGQWQSVGLNVSNQGMSGIPQPCRPKVLSSRGAEDEDIRPKAYLTAART